MATVTRGQTFGATEQVTNVKLHTLVDSASVTDIRNTDIAAGAGIDEDKITFDGSTVCTLADAQTIAGNKTFTGTSTFTGTVDLSGATVTTLMELIYPVGSIYANYAVATNPGTLLGVGTWVAIEEEVIAGYKAGGTFGTIGSLATGTETVTLTSAQSGIPAHTHPIARSGSGAGAELVSTGIGSTTNGVTLASTAANAASAHNNIQPTYVAYLWRRTA